MVMNPPGNAGDTKRQGLDPWVRKIPGKKKWQPTPVFLPGKIQGQRSLAGYSPWGYKELGTTEQLSVHFIAHTGELYIYITLPSEPQGKLKNSGVGSLSLL